MPLKAINDKAGVLGAKIRDLVQRHVALANRVTAPSALLPNMLASCGLGGGTLADSPRSRSYVQSLIDSVPTPSDAEIDAAGGGLLDAADRDNVRSAIRGEAVLRYVIGYLADRMPANDV